jgi:hypothetical protein
MPPPTCTLFLLTWHALGHSFVNLVSAILLDPVTFAAFCVEWPRNQGATPCLARKLIWLYLLSKLLAMVSSHSVSCLCSLPATKFQIAAAFRVEDWEVYCPDANGVMAVSSDLVYDDAPWLTKQQGGSSSAQKLRLVHQKISAVVGEKVGVQSLRLRLVHTTQDTLDFGLGVEVRIV